MKEGFPARPRHMAHTMLDFPVPLAPTITFRLGPGYTSQISYVLESTTIFDCYKHYVTLKKKYLLKKHFMTMLNMTDNFVKPRFNHQILFCKKISE